MDKLPPIEKVYEAWGALADGRVEPTSEGALVISSDRTKRYEVRRDGDAYRSNDNATYWQGYAGYPIIATLMLEGRLPYDEAAAQLFSGVDWHAVNAAHKGDYGAALAQVMGERGIDGVQERRVREAAGQVLERLASLDVAVGRNGRKPKGL